MPIFFVYSPSVRWNCSLARRGEVVGFDFSCLDAWYVIMQTSRFARRHPKQRSYAAVSHRRHIETLTRAAQLFTLVNLNAEAHIFSL